MAIKGKDYESFPSVVFFESFEFDTRRWERSKQDRYEGKWEFTEATDELALEGDIGLLVNSVSKHHGIIAPFNQLLENKGKDVIIQYEVRLTKNHECGGAYIKVFAHDTLPKDLGEFDDTTPYTIMFGPDHCGTVNKIHFILPVQNPITGEWEEKHLNKPTHVPDDRFTHLYTLIIHTDNTYALKLDNETLASGSLFEDFAPSVNPPKMIDDPNDKKPDDWVDEPLIPDPNAKKPKDWDESQPPTIVDEDAVKPSGWLDDEPEYIPNPEATKPEEWDDELDGEWEAPLIPNPKCEVGCGKWEKPRKPNPLYKGKWKAPLIDNPDYKGEWKPRKIENPDYYEIESPYHIRPSSAIGIEIWTVQDGVMFDNILVTYSQEIANELTEVWKEKYDYEKNIYDKKYSPSAFQKLLQVGYEYYKGILYFSSKPENYTIVIASVSLSFILPLLSIFLICRKKDSKYEELSSSEEEDEEEEKKDKKEKKESDKKKKE